MKTTQHNVSLCKGNKSLFFNKRLSVFFFSLIMFISSASAQVYNTRNLEGDCVRTQSIRTTGIEMVRTLSNDGTKIIEMPYVWFSGSAQVNNKQMAIEIAQREAFSAISRTVTNAVYDASEKYAEVCNERMNSVVASYWSQVSQSVIRGCEPFGDTVVEYDRNTGVYNVTAKVAMRGDRYTKMLEDAKQHKPANLTPTEINIFNNINIEVVNILQVNNF